MIEKATDEPERIETTAAEFNAMKNPVLRVQTRFNVLAALASRTTTTEEAMDEVKRLPSLIAKKRLQPQFFELRTTFREFIHLRPILKQLSRPRKCGRQRGLHALKRDEKTR